MTTYTLKVLRVIRETDSAVTICFKQPGLRKIKYKAGQYLTLIVRINGRRYLRPYSISSAPNVDETLDITIKRLPYGIVSNYIHDFLKVNDSIEVLPPMGDFVYDFESPINEVFLWGVGSGVTPLISIAKEILATQNGVNINLIYGNKSRQTTMFYDLLEDLRSKFSGRFSIWHFHTQPSDLDNSLYRFDGRLSSNSIFQLMKGKEELNTVHYICGPNQFKEMVRNSLNLLMVSEQRVFFEDFEVVKNPEDFKDQKTRVIQLSYLNELYNLEITRGKSVLECALDAGIELPYSCQIGNCNTCKAKIIAGKLQMTGLAKDRKDLSTDESLLCCSFPITDNVKVEI